MVPLASLQADLMRNGTALIDLDITQPLTQATDVGQLSGETEVLCRLSDRPLGFVRAPVEHGRLAIDQALSEFLAHQANTCGVALAERTMASGRPTRWPDAGALVRAVVPPANSGPLVTVAVFPTGRFLHLRRCLDALMALDYRPLDVLVVDTAPGSDIESMLRAEYPDVRYVRESRRGVSAGVERAIAECRGDILAFTDDEAVVDRYWVSSIVRMFLADPEVMVVTGLVIPREVRSGRRLSTDESRNVNASWRRRWHRVSADRRALVATAAGTPGTNIAFWRSVFDGSVNTEGTPDPTHTVIYEPSAIVRRGSWSAEPHTPVAVARADEWLNEFKPALRGRGSDARCRVDLGEPMRPIFDAVKHERVRVTVSWDGINLGEVGIEHHGAVVSAAWLTDVIAQDLTVPVLDAHTRLGETVLWATVTSTLAHALLPAIEASRRERRRRLSEAA